MTGWYTDTTILQTFPSVQGLSADQVAQAGEDGRLIYGHAQAHPGIVDEDLRGWAMSQGITTDRVNAALALLTDGGQLVLLPTAPSAMATTAAPRAASPATVPAAALTAVELKKAAKRLNVTVPSSATKDEVAAAIMDAVG